MLDAVEMLAKESFRRQKYEQLALRLGKPLLSGSDSHVWTQLGLGYVDVDIEKYSISAFKDAIKNNNFSLKLSPVVETMTEVSMIYREFLTQ